MDLEREVSQDEATRMATEMQCDYYETRSTFLLSPSHPHSFSLPLLIFLQCQNRKRSEGDVPCSNLDVRVQESTAGPRRRWGW